MQYYWVPINQDVFEGNHTSSKQGKPRVWCMELRIQHRVYAGHVIPYTCCAKEYLWTRWHHRCNIYLWHVVVGRVHEVELTCVQFFESHKVQRTLAFCEYYSVWGNQHRSSTRSMKKLDNGAEKRRVFRFSWTTAFATLIVVRPAAEPQAQKDVVLPEVIYRLSSIAVWIVRHSSWTNVADI